MPWSKSSSIIYYAPKFYYVTKVPVRNFYYIIFYPMFRKFPYMSTFLYLFQHNICCTKIVLCNKSSCENFRYIIFYPTSWEFWLTMRTGSKSSNENFHYIISHHRIFQCQNRSMVGLLTLRFHWNVTNCNGIRINNIRIILHLRRIYINSIQLWQVVKFGGNQNSDKT